MTDALTAGSIAFTGYTHSVDDATTSDTFNFAALTDITAGTVINFTKDNWNGTGFNTSEGTWTWTATSDIAAGTVITLENLTAAYGQPMAPTSNHGAVTYQGVANPEFSAETLYAYVGNASAPTFLTAFSNWPYYSNQSVLDGTGLTAGINAINISDKAAGGTIAAYNGPTSGFASFDDFRAALANLGNWDAQTYYQGSPYHDGLPPDAPLSTTPFTIDPTVQTVGFADQSLVTSTVEGSAGQTSTLSFTVVRSGATAGDLTFSGSLIIPPGSGIDADDFGGTLPTFSGVIPDGQASVVVTINVAGDIKYEADEAFQVKLDNTSNPQSQTNVGGAGTATATIVNDDAPQSVAFAGDSRSVIVTEGDNGTKVLTFKVERSGGGNLGDLNFTVQFVPGNSNLNADDFGGVLPDVIHGTIADGQDSATISVTISGDTRFEADDFFQLVLTSVDNAPVGAVIDSSGASAFVTIANDDPMPNAVPPGDLAEGRITMSGTNLYSIGKGAVLYDASESPLLWTGANSYAVLNNDGTIRGDSSALTVDGSAQGTLVINNSQSGAIYRPIDLNSQRAGATVNIINSGLMDGVSAYALRISNQGNFLLNNLAGGLITNENASSDVIKNGGNSVINNMGQIVSKADGDDGFGNRSTGGDAIDFGAGTNDVVHNYNGGAIIGSHHALTSKKGVTVINDAGGVMVGRNGSAVNVDNDASVANTVYVTNRGTLTGASANYSDSDGDAIDADGLLSLDNYGLIQGIGANGYHDGEANVSEGVAAGGGVINNYAGGTIYGFGRAIQIDNSSNGPALGATTIYNEGLIRGDGHGPTGVSDEDAAAMNANIVGREAIDILGSFADTITNKGQIVGGVFTDGGDDVFNAYAGSTVAGKIDLGAGNDTVNLYGSSISGMLGAIANVENLNVKSGTWSISGVTGVSNIDIADGATVANAMTLSGTQHLTIEHGGNAVGAISWQGTNAATIIDNDGVMWSGLSSGTVTGSLVVNNHEDGEILAGLNFNGGTNGTTIQINNDGLMQGNGNFALRISRTGSATVTVTNSSTGVITSTLANKDVVSWASHTSIDNYGKIVSAADTAGDNGGDAIDFNSGIGNSVHNGAGGLIAGSHHAVTGEKGLTVVNDAGGVVIGRNGSAVNVDNDATVANTVYVTNRGTMIGGSANYSDSDGDAIDTDGLLKLDNYGLVEGIGANGYHDGEANVSEGIAAGGGVINNYAGATIYGYGRAIQIDNSSNGPALGATTIYNEGQIRGDGHGPTGVSDGDAAAMNAKIIGGEAINIVGSYADSITNSGGILGGVKTDGGNDTLINSGLMVATGGSAIDLGDGNDSFTNSGIVSGKVLLGAGDDTVNIYAGSTSGTIDGGEGYDTIHAYAAPGSSAAGVVGPSVNVERLDIASGTWMLGYGFDGANIEVESGATITSGAAATAMGLTGGQTLTIDQGGTVVGTKFAIGISGGDTDAIVVNSGTIRVASTPGTKADAITMNGGTATIHNTSTGYIDGARHAITGPLGVHVINDAGGVIVGRNGSAVNMDNGPIVAYTAYVDNYGTMLGQSANISDSDGDAIDVDGFAVINNYGSIRGEGANGYHKGEANVSEGIAIGGGTINNYAGGNIYGYGRAIEVDNSSNAAAFSSTIINNAGMIEGGGHGPTGVADADVALFVGRLKGGEAINIIGSYADTITNSGNILGGVKTDGGDDTLTNSGLMVATGGSAIDLGDGNDSFTNSGIVSGDVLLGGGGDTINLVTGSTVSGIIDGGTGTDTIRLSGTGNGTLGKATGVETLDVASGSWAIDSGAAYGNVAVESGADLEVRGAVSTVTVAQGAGLYVYGTAEHVTVLGTQGVHAGGVVTDMTIGSGGTAFALAGASVHNVTFAGADATLTFDRASDLSGSISGWQDGNHLDLSDIVFGEGTTTLAYAANDDSTGGTLTVSDGAHTVSLAMLGQYTAADFAISSDGHGGTMIVDPGVQAQTQLAVHG